MKDDHVIHYTTAPPLWLESPLLKQFPPMPLVVTTVNRVISGGFKERGSKRAPASPNCKKPAKRDFPF